MNGGGFYYGNSVTAAQMRQIVPTPSLAGRGYSSSVDRPHLRPGTGWWIRNPETAKLTSYEWWRVLLREFGHGRLNAPSCTHAWSCRAWVQLVCGSSAPQPGQVSGEVNLLAHQMRYLSLYASRSAKGNPAIGKRARDRLQARLGALEPRNRQVHVL
jgi:hypothetical protein